MVRAVLYSVATYVFQLGSPPDEGLVSDAWAVTAAQSPSSAPGVQCFGGQGSVASSGEGGCCVGQACVCEGALLPSRPLGLAPVQPSLSAHCISWQQHCFHGLVQIFLHGVWYLSRCIARGSSESVLP